MATRAKKKKKKKKSECPHLLTDFKIISKKCSSYTPLPKLLKWLSVTKQSGTRAKNKTKQKKSLNYIFS